MSTEDSEKDVERAIALVERAIRGLGVDPAASRRAEDGRVTYALRRGSARIIVGIYAPDEGRRDGRLRVAAPVVRLPAPEQQLALFRRVLEANADELAGSAFAISGDEVVLVAERGVADLDASEVDSTIREIGRLADRYDDELAEAFGAARSSDGT